MENTENYKQKRNKYFTPEIEKRIITLSFDSESITKSLEEDFKIPTKNIIGFKMLKSNFIGNGGTNHYIDLTIDEIPEIACDKDENGTKIFARIPLRKADDFYTHQYLELSLLDRYFYPINLNNLTFTLSLNLVGFISVEISYLNELL